MSFKTCHVLLHRLPESQLPLLRDKAGESKIENRKPYSRRRGSLTPNALESHKQLYKVKRCRETRLSKQRNAKTLKAGKQNKVSDLVCTKKCYVLLHRLSDSQLAVLKDKAGESKIENRKPYSKRGRYMAADTSKSHNQNYMANHFDIYTCRAARLSKQRKEKTLKAEKQNKVTLKAEKQNKVSDHVSTKKGYVLLHRCPNSRLPVLIGKNGERIEFVCSNHNQKPIPRVIIDSKTGILHWEKEDTNVKGEYGIISWKRESLQSFIRFGFQIYFKEFKRYLYNLSKLRKAIKNFAHSSSGIEDELIFVDQDFNHYVNESLVKWIMKRSFNVEVSVENQWHTIKNAIIDAENEVLKKKLEILRSEQRMAEEKCNIQKQKMKKLPEKKNVRIHLLEENDVTIKTIDKDQTTSATETVPPNKLQSAMRKNVSTTRNPGQKYDETALHDYDVTAKLLLNEDPESSGFVDNNENYNITWKPSNGPDDIVLKVNTHLGSLDTNQTVLEYECSQEHSNRCGKNVPKSSTKVHLFEENDVTVKIIDKDKASSGTETVSSDLQSAMMTSKIDSIATNPGQNYDETLLHDYVIADTPLLCEDLECNSFVDNDANYNMILEASNGPDDIVLKDNDQQENLDTNQTALECENSLEDNEVEIISDEEYETANYYNTNFSPTFLNQVFAEDSSHEKVVLANGKTFAASNFFNEVEVLKLVTETAEKEVYENDIQYKTTSKFAEGNYNKNEEDKCLSCRSRAKGIKSEILKTYCILNHTTHCYLKGTETP